MGSKDIGNIAEIIKNDFKSAFSNPIVIIVLVAIIILPSLYALLNIQACWDPYGNTGNVEFAIANLDNGTTMEGKKLNIGNELVKDLKKNDKFKWTFVTEDELRDGVYEGKYYAGIVIPKNLSENVVSITKDNPKQAKLEYVVNVKSNPVATKLTDTASPITPNKAKIKLFSLVNFLIFFIILFLFLSSTTSQPESLLFMKLLRLIIPPIIATTAITFLTHIIDVIFTRTFISA